jgi:hypothetical protein
MEKEEEAVKEKRRRSEERHIKTMGEKVKGRGRRKGRENKRKKE